MTRTATRWTFGLMLALTAVLYGGFLDNPKAFDDYVIFGAWKFQPPGAEPAWGPRWLSLWLLAQPYRLDAPVWVYRLFNLFAHAAVGAALFAFLRALSRVALPKPAAPGETVVLLLGVLIFLAHPAAVYAVAYLTQFTIVLATLFAVTMWWAFVRGLESGRAGWFALSVGCYALALSSKEHTVTAPAVCALLTVLYARTHGWAALTGRAQVRWGVPLALLACAVLALYVTLWFKGLLGSAYEPLARDIGTFDVVPPLHNLYALSVFNQAANFLHYLGLWLLPNPLWMSIDMREPFATSFGAWPQAGMAAGALVYALAGCWLLWRGGRVGLAGLAMLAPLGLFLTEFSTVRVQEPFVLYRSYFWMAPAFAAVLLLARRDARKTAFMLTLVLVGVSAFTLQRLTTFTSPYRLWDDAASYAERSGDRQGAARIFNNRGLTYYNAGLYELAIADFSRALEGSPPVLQSLILNNRAQAYQQERRLEAALADTATAINLDPNTPRNHETRASVLRALGRPEEAQRHLLIACSLSSEDACKGLGNGMTPERAAEAARQER